MREISHVIDPATERGVENERVAARAAGEDVRAEPAKQIIPAVAAVDGVRTGLTVQLVVTSETMDHIAARGATQRFRRRGSSH